MSVPPPINPYAPPNLAASPFAPQANPDAPNYQLFSIAAITTAGFLGGIVSATVLMALNSWRLEKQGAATAFLAYGLLVTVLLFPVALALPQTTPEWPFWIGNLVFSYLVAVATQRKSLARHLEQGGKTAHVGWAILVSLGIGMLGGIVALIVVPLAEGVFTP